MRVWTLGSGSKGNAVLIECGATRVLVDAGFGTRTLKQRLDQIAVAPESIDALVITHEHSDHVKGAARAALKWQWPVFATAGTIRQTPSLRACAPTVVRASVEFTVGDLTLAPVRTSHDAQEPIGVVATGCKSGMRAAVITDLGIVTEAVRRAVKNVDVLVIESNHDEDMLLHGPYPWYLKKRIAGEHGHLSNGAAGDLVTECIHRGLRQLVLAHLSETNNTPKVALGTMNGALRKTRWHGGVSAAPQDRAVGPFGDTTVKRVAAQQLAFAF